MHTVMDSSEVEEVVTGVQEEAPPSYLTTTLYDLIAAIQEVVGVDDALVVATVVQLLRSGRLTVPEKARARLAQSRHVERRAEQCGFSRATQERSRCESWPCAGPLPQRMGSGGQEDVTRLEEWSICNGMERSRNPTASDA